MPSARPTSPSADSAPLLPSDSQHFTIDGSTYSDDEGELDADGAPKYPPAAPPPSYAQVYGHSSGERSFARYLPACLDEVSLPSLNLASIPDKIKAALFKVYVFVLRAWPNSRLGQAGLALAGMWIILIFGGPAFEESSGGARGGGGGWWGGMSVGDIEIDEDLRVFDSAPEPISGDGHIIAPAIWSSSHCALFATQGTLPSCTTTTNFSVAIPTAFEGTASVFVYADPLRGAGLSNGRGRVPGAVRLRVDEAQQKGFVDIRVKARYERGRPDLLRGATVARVTGSTHEGLGIYTPVLSSAYLGRVAPPLSFDIEVVLPSAALIPSLRIHASAMDIWHMSNPPITDPHVRLFPFHNMGASGELVGSDANGGATKDNEPTFGVLKLSSGDGAIKVGPVGAKAVGGVKLRSTSGGIVVAGPVDTQALEVTSDNGKITMQSWVKAWKDVKLITLNGDINLAKGSEVMCETIEARSRNGNVGGQGVWATNGTLILKSDSGRISSSISILPTKGASVSVTAHSGNEAVSLYYVAHALGVALQSKARSQLATAFTRLHPAYVGRWSVKGAREQTEVKRPADAADARRYESEGVKKGTMDQSETGWIGKDAKGAQGSQVEVSSQMGGAHLRFD